MRFRPLDDFSPRESSYRILPLRFMRWSTDEVFVTNDAGEFLFEPVGLAIPNADELWMDPWDYRNELERAVLFLAARGMPVSVYNHQLCTVSPAIRGFCRQSISDWKNEFLPVCTDCALRNSCAGFFASSVRLHHSTHILPMMESA